MWVAAVLLLALLAPGVCMALGGCEQEPAQPSTHCCVTKCERADEPIAPPAPLPPTHRWSCCDERGLLTAPTELSSPRVLSAADVGASLPAPRTAAERQPMADSGVDPPPLRVPLYTLHATLLI